MTTDSPERVDESLEFVRSRCEEFYREPSIGAYFNTRLAILAAVHEHREQFVAWADEGVRFHELHITIPSLESDDTSDSPSANSDPMQWYIQTETISLQHHALETLLRLYTGLLEASNWLDPLIALTDRRRNLPTLVEQHLTSNSKSRRDMRSDASYLLLGRSEVPEDDADQVAAIDNLSGILQALARRWLDGRHAYNAIKHGLLISQSNASLRVGLTAENMVTIGDGPSIAYLNHTNWEPQHRSEGSNGGRIRHWTIETRWIRFEQASKVIAVACVLIDCMWSLAVARWSQADVDEVRVPVFDPDEINPSTLTSDSGSPGHKMTQNLFTQTKPA